MTPGNGPRPVDLIIWDLDGTLAETAEDIADSLNRTLAKRGLAPHSLQEVREFIGGGIQNLIARAMEIDDPTDPRVTDEVMAFRGDYGANLVVKTALCPGAREAIEHFRGKAQVVISNKLQDMTREIVSRLIPYGVMREVIGQGGDYPLKPDPASTNAMIAAHGTTAERTVFLGDSETDHDTARNAGCLSGLVTFGMRPREEMLALDADFHMDDLRELKNFIC
jgi:phosphoglycolate phosphatase